MATLTVEPQLTLLASPPHLPLEVVLHIVAQLDPTRPSQRHTLALFAAASRACNRVAERTLYAALSLDGHDIRALADDAPLRPVRRRKLAAARFVRLVSPLAPADMDALYALARAGDGGLSPPAPLFPAATAVHLADTRRVLKPRMTRPGPMPPSDVRIFMSPKVCVDGLASYTLLKYLPCACPPQITAHLNIELSFGQDVVPAWKSYTVFNECADPYSLCFVAQVLCATRGDMPDIELHCCMDTATRELLPMESRAGIESAFNPHFYSGTEAHTAEGCPVCSEWVCVITLTEGMTWAGERPDAQALLGLAPRVGRAQFEERRAEWTTFGLVSE